MQIENYENFTLLISSISRSIRRIKTQEMAQYGLKGPYATCLSFLYHMGPMTSAALCESCDEDKGAISRAMNDLEARGLLYRDNNTNRYRCLIHLTEEGREVAAQVSKTIESFVDEAKLGLDEEERQMMYACLEKINRNLQEAADAACERKETK